MLFRSNCLMLLCLSHKQKPKDVTFLVGHISHGFFQQTLSLLISLTLPYHVDLLLLVEDVMKLSNAKAVITYVQHLQESTKNEKCP